jgi:hypothetical protein
MIQEIIAQLLAGTAGTFALVEGAAELAAIDSAPAQTPAAYVFSKGEASAENERLTGVLQRTEVDIGVVIITANVADGTGAAAAADLEVLKAAVRSALIGWQPASADDVITHVGGELIRARDGVVWWEMTLASAYYVEA